MVDVVNATRVGGDKATVLVTSASGEQVRARAVVLVSADGIAAQPADAVATAPWTGSAIDTKGYSSVLVNFTNITGGDSYVVKGSLTGANPKILMGVNLGDLTTAASITADGLYSFPAAGQITFVKTGTASTPTVNLMLKR